MIVHRIRRNMELGRNDLRRLIADRITRQDVYNEIEDEVEDVVEQVRENRENVPETVQHSVDNLMRQFDRVLIV